VFGAIDQTIVSGRPGAHADETPGDDA